jgi:hypothetical protein
MQSPKYFDWFATVERHRQDRPPEFPGLRDPAAFFETGAELERRGMRFGKIILSFPRTTEELRALSGQPELSEIDESFLGPDRLLVVTTRIALSDFLFENRRALRAALNKLSAKLFDIGWLHFEKLARSHSELTAHFASQLHGDFTNRAIIEFTQNKGAFYMKCQRLDGGGKQTFTRSQARTACFVLHAKGVPTLNGADLLVLFGMGGVETLVLAYHLRNGLSHLLDEPCFAMIEFEGAERPANEPSNLRFASLWRPRVILHAAPLLPASPSSEAAVKRVLAGPRSLLV